MAADPRDRVPHFDVTTADGRRARYAELWQRRNLVLIALPETAGEAGREYVAALRARLSALRPEDTALVAVANTVPEVPSESLLISDRWGEVVHAVPLPSDVAAWPPPDEVLEWVHYIRIQCPECPP